MTDIRTQLTQIEPGTQPTFDWLTGAPGLATDDGLETAIILSLFTDRLADADDIIPDDSGDRRGWWGDSFSDVPGDLFGSRLWLLEREKDLREVVQKARGYAAESLQWIIDDQVAEKVDVEAGWVDSLSGELLLQKTALAIPGVLGINVTITRGKNVIFKHQFSAFWSTR